MQVTAQVLRPGVQHQREGADAAQPARVGGELGERGGRALHQRVVDPARVHTGQRVELVRQREDQVAVRHVEQLGQPRRAPGIAGAALALRAVPVAARVPAPLLGARNRRSAAAGRPAPACGRRRWRARHAPAPCSGDARAGTAGPKCRSTSASVVAIAAAACSQCAGRAATRVFGGQAALGRLRQQRPARAAGAHPGGPGAGSARWC